MRKSFKIKKIGISVAPKNHTKFLRYLNSFNQKMIVVSMQADGNFNQKYYYHYDLVYVAFLDISELENYGILYIPKF